METWILLIVIYGYQASFVKDVEFTSEKACLIAKSDFDRKVQPEISKVFALCEKK